MADDWFKVNAPGRTGAPVHSETTPSSSRDTKFIGPPSDTANWFKLHSPGRGGAPVKDDITPDPNASFFKEAGKTALSSLPFIGSVVATIGSEGILTPMMLAAAGGMAGESAKQAISPDEGIDSTGELLKKVGGAGLEYGLGEGVGRGLGKLAGMTIGKKLDPTNLFSSGLQPHSRTPGRPLTLKQLNELADTAMEYGVAPSEKGMAKLASVKADLHGAAMDLIRTHNNNPNIFPISRIQVAKRLSDVTREFANPNVNALPGAASKEISDIGQEFVKSGNPFLSLTEAQEMKSNIYRDLPGKYGKQGSASIESQKALARGLLEELSARVPEIRALGLKESSVIKLEEQMARMLARERNKRVTGLIPATLMAGGGSAAGFHLMGREGAEVGAGLGVGMGKVLAILMDNPEIKGQLANVLRRASGTAVGRTYRALVPYAAPTAVKGLVGAVDTQEHGQEQQ